VLSCKGARIPRRALQLSAGALLSAFGAYWAGLGVGVSRPGGEPAQLWLAAVNASTAVALLAFVRGRLSPGRPGRTLDEDTTEGAALPATWGLQRAGLPAWWLLPAAVIGFTTVSLRRATKGGRRPTPPG
jgi:hypothetical protein